MVGGLFCRYPGGVKITRTPLGNNQVPLLKINENISFHHNQTSFKNVAGS